MEFDWNSLFHIGSSSAMLAFLLKKYLEGKVKDETAERPKGCSMCANCCSNVKKNSCCSYCLSNLRGETNYPSHRAYNPCNPILWSPLSMVLKRPTVNGSGHPVPSEFNDPEFKNQFPTLYEYVSSTAWDDGKVRKTSTLLLFVEDGALKVCLNDRALLRQAFVSARTFTETLSLLDDQLRDDTVTWRANKPIPGKK